MRKSIFIVFFVLLTAPLFGQLEKNRSFKFDPLGGAFHEIRVSVENRWRGHNWIYISPYVFHRNYFKNENQKHFGPGFRVAFRKYLFTDYSPDGFFLHAHAGYRLTFIRYLSDNLEITDKTMMHSPSLGFNVGHQWLYGPRMKNFAFGVMGGLEYFFNFRKTGFRDRDLPESWFQLPFSWKPDILDGFRVYLGFEIGFAFRQRDRHW